MNLLTQVLILSFNMSEDMGKRRLMSDVKTLKEGGGLTETSEENSKQIGIGPYIQVADILKQKGIKGIHQK